MFCIAIIELLIKILKISKFIFFYCLQPCAQHEPCKYILVRFTRQYTHTTSVSRHVPYKYIFVRFTCEYTHTTRVFKHVPCMYMFVRLTHQFSRTTRVSRHHVWGHHVDLSAICLWPPRVHHEGSCEQHVATIAINISISQECTHHVYSRRVWQSTLAQGNCGRHQCVSSTLFYTAKLLSPITLSK